MSTTWSPCLTPSLTSASVPKSPISVILRLRAIPLSTTERMTRTTRGIELIAAGRAFLDHTQGTRAFGEADPFALWRVAEDCNQRGRFAADLLQKQ